MSDEPLAVVQKNKSEQIHVRLSEYEGRAFLDVRLYFLPRDSDEMQPTRKGVTFSPRKLPEMIAALQAAEAAARERGLIGDVPADREQPSSTDTDNPAACMAAG